MRQLGKREPERGWGVWGCLRVERLGMTGIFYHRLWYGFGHRTSIFMRHGTGIQVQLARGMN